MSHSKPRSLSALWTLSTEPTGGNRLRRGNMQRGASKSSSLATISWQPSRANLADYSAGFRSIRRSRVSGGYSSCGLR